MTLTHLLDLPTLEKAAQTGLPSAVGFPCAQIEGAISSAAFDRLSASFPPREVFEEHSSLPRRFGQRPHDRLYLELGTSLYHPNLPKAPGAISVETLSAPWREFIGELETGPYRQLVARCLGVRQFRMRYTWHVAGRGSEVSPHRDAREKFGTHLFYFNPDWDPHWGGQFIALSGKRTRAMNPEISEFSLCHAFPTSGNTSVLFRNTRHAWHAVARLPCPKEKERRVFNVIFDAPSPRLWRLVDWAEGVARDPRGTAMRLLARWRPTS